MAAESAAGPGAAGRRVAAQEAREARYLFQSAKYNRAGIIIRAPNADIARDPRLGRTEEVYGEDPFLVGTLATSFTRGLQGENPRYWMAASLLKHFLANSNEDRRTSSSLKGTQSRVIQQVRDAWRTIGMNAKRIETTRAARELAAQRLEAERERFDVGMSTSFLVIQAQRDLAQARTNELRAILAYNLALVDFDALQQAGPSSAAGSDTSTTLPSALTAQSTSGASGGVQ